MNANRKLARVPQNQCNISLVFLPTCITYMVQCIFRSNNQTNFPAFQNIILHLFAQIYAAYIYNCHSMAYLPIETEASLVPVFLAPVYFSFFFFLFFLVNAHLKPLLVKSIG